MTAPDSSDQTCNKCIIVTIFALIIITIFIKIVHIIFRTEMFVIESCFASTIHKLRPSPSCGCVQWTAGDPIKRKSQSIAQPSISRGDNITPSNVGYSATILFVHLYRKFTQTQSEDSVEIIMIICLMIDGCRYDHDGQEEKDNLLGGVQLPIFLNA